MNLLQNSRKLLNRFDKARSEKHVAQMLNVRTWSSTAL